VIKNTLPALAAKVPGATVAPVPEILSCAVANKMYGTEFVAAGR
jgi:hypothetical protein